MVNNNNYPFIDIKNMGNFLAFFSVKYTDGETNYHRSSGTFYPHDDRTVFMPPTANNIHLKVWVLGGTGTVWKVIYSGSFPQASQYCFVAYGTYEMPEFNPVPCFATQEEICAQLGLNPCNDCCNDCCNCCNTCLESMCPSTCDNSYCTNLGDQYNSDIVCDPYCMNPYNPCDPNVCSNPCCMNPCDPNVCSDPCCMNPCDPNVCSNPYCMNPCDPSVCSDPCCMNPCDQTVCSDPCCMNSCDQTVCSDPCCMNPCDPSVCSDPYCMNPCDPSVCSDPYCMNPYDYYGQNVCANPYDPYCYNPYNQTVCNNNCCMNPYDYYNPNTCGNPYYMNPCGSYNPYCENMYNPNPCVSYYPNSVICNNTCASNPNSFMYNTCASNPYTYSYNDTCCGYNC